MDNLETRKWFVYIGDHHEGPFTVQEIHAKLQAGAIAGQQYVWCEGMADWQPMNEIPEFKPPEPQPTPSPVAEPAPEVVSHESLAPIEISPAPTPAQHEPSIEFRADIGLQHEPQAARPAKQGARVSRKRLAIYLSLATVICAGAWIYAQGWTDSKILSARWEKSLDGIRPRLISVLQKFPFLSKVISPLQGLPDVTPEELAELKAAVLHPIAAGPRIAIALSRENLRMPVFYIATNLPEGTRFDIVVRGIPDTLLNQLEFLSTGRATVANRLAVTEPLRTKDGRPVPMGDFTVLAYESETQPEATQNAIQALRPVDPTDPSIPKGVKIVSTKQYFLGGTTRDEHYLTRLKSFHDKLRQRALDELAELKQFSGTLMTQYEDTVKFFRKYRKVPPHKSNKRAWNAFAPKWQRLQANLVREFSKWTADLLKSDYFYSSIYALTKNAGEIVGKIHSMHDSYFNKRVDVKSFQIQLGALESDGERALTMVREKIVQAENLQPTPSGMPRRDGL